MKTTTWFLSMYYAAALLQCLPTTIAAASGPTKLKGSTRRKAAAATATSRTNVRGRNHRHLQLKDDKGIAPTNRECKYGEKNQEVKFTCKARSAAEVASSRSDEFGELIEDRGISLNPDESIRDKIAYKVTTDRDNKNSNQQGGIRVAVEYSQDYRDSEDADFDEVKTQFEVVFDRIVEYSKGGGDPATAAAAEEGELSMEEQAYNWDTDEVLQTVYLNEWDRFSSVVDADDGVVSHFSIQSLDNITSFNFSISRADIGEKVTANTMKIDVRITNFPWLRSDTNLALMSTVKSKLKVDMAFDEEAMATARSDGEGNSDNNNEPGHKKNRAVHARDVQISFNDAVHDIGFVPFGAYTWEDLAQVTNTITLESDGDNNNDNDNVIVVDNCYTVMVTESYELQRSRCGDNATTVVPEEIVEQVTDTIRVVATSPPQLGNETFQQIAYSFVGSAAHNASEIYWDPEAGIGYSAAVRGLSSSLASILSAIAVSGMMVLAFTY